MLIVAAQREIVTVRSIQGGIENELVRQPLSPSTIYVNGFAYIRALSQLAALSSGKYAVERNVAGIMMRFIIRENACGSSILEAKAIPSPTAKNAVSDIMNRPGINPIRLISAPNRMLIARIVSPWIIEMVAPPRVLPTTIENLLTGATKISFRNPNCLSQIIDTPANIDANTIERAAIPGARKSRKLIPILNPGSLMGLRPSPRNARKKNG